MKILQLGARPNFEPWNLNPFSLLFYVNFFSDLYFVANLYVGIGKLLYLSAT